MTTSRKSKAPPADPIMTLTNFIDKVTLYAAADGALRCYRGQSNKAWKRVPGLLRPDRKKLEDNERFAVRDLMAVQPREFAEDTTMFDRLVRMQHFELPTRLMDVSLNPLVALYFATEAASSGADTDGVVTGFLIPKGREKYYDSDAVSCIANLANLTSVEKASIIALKAARLKARQGEGSAPDATYPRPAPDSDDGSAREIAKLQRRGDSAYRQLAQFIRAEKPYFLSRISEIDLFKPFYVHPKMSNRRIVAQAGGFIIFGLNSPKEINFKHKLVQTDFLIPADAKADIRRSLDLLGINESTLFPELDRAAKRIGAKYSV